MQPLWAYKTFRNKRKILPTSNFWVVVCISLHYRPITWCNLISVFQYVGAEKEGGEQSLVSTGSCLQNFRSQPFVECRGPVGTCQYFATSYSFWLTKVDAQHINSNTQSPVLKNHEDVSKCNVCMMNDPNNWYKSCMISKKNKTTTALRMHINRSLDWKWLRCFWSLFFSFF